MRTVILLEDLTADQFGAIIDLLERQDANFYTLLRDNRPTVFAEGDVGAAGWRTAQAIAIRGALDTVDSLDNANVLTP